MANVNVFLAVVVLALGVASAISPEEKAALKEAVIPIISSCREEFGITREEAVEAKKKGDIDALNPCFYACFFKKVGFITDAGLFDPDVAVEKNKKYIKDDEAIKSIEAVAKTCTAVNDESVSDGAKGCERAKLLLSCFLKEKSVFSPFSAESE